MNGPQEGGPLAGLTIIEFGSMLMVPYACQLLGDLGADVVKVEGRRPDPGRALGGSGHEELSGVALNVHRNKRAVQIDLGQPLGRRAFDDLVRSADVFITNLRPKALEKLEVTYSALREINASLVYCEAHGFASSGSEANRPTVDDVVQAECGATSLRIGEPSLLPMLLADKQVGLSLALATTAALLARQRSGCGQHVEVPMFDTFLSFTLVEHLNAGALPDGQPGYSRIRTGDHGPYRTADGYLTVMPIYDRHWTALMGASADETGSAAAPDGNETGGPPAAPGAAQRILSRILRTKPNSSWVRLCRTHDIPYGEVTDLEQLVREDGPHRGALARANHPTLGTYWSPNVPFEFSLTPASVRRHAPFVGQHTAEVFTQLGWTDEDVASLQTQIGVEP